MALDSGDAIDLVQLYVGQAGVSNESLNPVLLREMLNIKLREFIRETGILTSKWTLTSVASQMEYQLPAGCYSVTKCNFDSYEAHKTTFPAKDSLAGNIS